MVFYKFKKICLIFISLLVIFSINSCTETKKNKEQQNKAVKNNLPDTKNKLSNKPTINKNIKNEIENTKDPDFPEPDITELNLGANPYIKPEMLLKCLNPLVDYLKEKTGIKINIYISKNYNDLVEKLAAGEVEIGQLSPLAYVNAKNKIPNLVLLAGQIAEGGMEDYVGYILSKRDFKANSLKELKGKSFAFVDKNSASGYLYPLSLVLDMNVLPEEFFSKVVFSGNHIHSISMVLNGEVEAAATYSGAMEIARAKGLNVADLSIIAKTQRIPYDALCILDKIPMLLITKLRTAMLNLNTRTEEGRVVLSAGCEINGYIKVDDSKYDSVRAVLSKTSKYKKNGK